MIKPEILFLGGGPDWYLARFAEDFTLHHSPDGSPAGIDQAVAARIEALVSGAPVDARLIAALPRLRLIAHPGIGYDKIDVAAARARGIIVTNAPGATDICVADMALGLLLALARDILVSDRFLRAGHWQAKTYPRWPRRVSRLRMGVLGLGRIGLNIARRGEAFEMPVAYHNRHRRADLPYLYCNTPLSLAEWADVLMIACPGGDATHHIVDAAVLRALGRDGLVVNISRGSVIDEAALVAALQKGTIAGAALDVFEHEPAVPAALMALDNVVLTPHRAGSTLETWNETADVTRANLWAFFRGEPVRNPIPEN